MEYGPKWIEENLGIKRSTLRVYERNGLIRANKDSSWRTYSEEEIDRIWMIKVLAGVGFSHKEIRRALSGQEFDVRKGIEDRMQSLERKKDELERNIRYLEIIRRTGSMPLWPKQGLQKVDEFQAMAQAEYIDHAEEVWDEYDERLPELVNKALSRLGIEEVLNLIVDEHSVLFSEGNQVENSIAYDVLRKRIAAKCGVIPYDDKRVQVLVEELHEVVSSAWNYGDNMDKDLFAHHLCRAHMGFGDVAEISRRVFGEATCEYIANAIAVFAGYDGAAGIIEKGGLDF